MLFHALLTTFFQSVFVRIDETLIFAFLFNRKVMSVTRLKRKNRKDIQIREQQFFDWKLKGDKPAKWLTDGVPATQKGIDWGLKVE